MIYEGSTPHSQTRKKSLPVIPYPIGGTSNQTLGKNEKSATYSHTYRDMIFFNDINNFSNV